MSKPQLASEPSMDEILASIRKMISDDRPGPNPMPDQMGRTPFGSAAKTVIAEYNGRTSPLAAPGDARANGTQPASFNSLADALKVATTLSDQRRSLQQEIASVLEKGSRGNIIDPLSGASATHAAPAANRLDNVHQLPESPAAPSAAASGHRQANIGNWDTPQAPHANGEKRDLMSFDFGTVVPQRDSQGAKAPEAKVSEVKASDATTAPVDVGGAAKNTMDTSDAKSGLKADAEPAQTRIVAMPARTSSPGPASSSPSSPSLSSPSLSAPSGLNGSSMNGSAAGMTNGSTIAPFPRAAKPATESVRPFGEALRPAVETTEAAAAVVPTPEPTAVVETVAEAIPPESDAAPTVAEAAAAQADALLDAVVDMVQQQPGSLSVFTSGASFIGGIGAKKAIADAVAAASGPPAGTDQTAAASSSEGAAPPKLDRAAAELLRPMLRQWLADNMPRIVEEALRSELTETTQSGGNEPGKG